jgi:putative ABC transport system permease protein
MLKNYFKIAFRQLEKQKMYSAIKIGGFALGIAACLLIALFIRDELSYDKNYVHGDRIYRLLHEYDNNGKARLSWSNQAPIAVTLKKDFPEVEKAARMLDVPLFKGAGSNEVKKAEGTQSLYETGFAYADHDLLDILDIHMVYGDRAHALTQPNTLVLTRRKAEKYFPGENPVGKVLKLNNESSYTIAGVMEDFPADTHFQYDFLLTLKGIEFWPGEQNNWANTNYFTYVQLRPGANVKQFEAKLDVLNKQYILPYFLQIGFRDPEKIVNANKYHLQRVSDIHIDADVEDGHPHGDIRFIWLFGTVAFFILFLACINFVNLVTAKSAGRAREVGLRKTLGSLRVQLIRQFLAESLLMSGISFILGVLLAWLLLPLFNVLTDKSLVIPWQAWWLAPILLFSALATGLLAGIYPAFYLSSFRPIQVLKGNGGPRTFRTRRNGRFVEVQAKGAKGAGLRSTLVVFQFTTSIILIIGTMVIYNQVQYIMHKKVGFDKDQVMLIQGTDALGAEIKTFRSELKRLPVVADASIGDYLPIAGTKRNGGGVWAEGKTNADRTHSQFWVIDENYLPTVGMHLVAGRNFSPQIVSDSQAVIINQTLAQNLNLGKDPVGKRIEYGDGLRTVIGIVEDFNFESMRQNAIDGVVMTWGLSPGIVSVKLKTADMSQVIPAVTAVWKKFTAGQPIRFTFMDQGFASMYADVQRTTGLITGFAVLAVIIACLGLFALSAYMAEQRSKEIGIRKVLGASIGGITTLISKDFIKLVLISILIASPIAWLGMNKWLEDFVYRAPISAWVFVLAALGAIAIALFTVSFQSIKAAKTNPTKSLRSE